LFRLSTKKQTADRPTDTATQTPFSKMNHIRPKLVNIEAHLLFQSEPYSPKIGEIEAHFFFQNGPYSTKIGELEAHF